MNTNQEASSALALANGSAVFYWKIDIEPESQEDQAILAACFGTHAQASQYADKLADSASFSVRVVRLAPCFEVSPNVPAQPRPRA